MFITRNKTSCVLNIIQVTLVLILVIQEKIISTSAENTTPTSPTEEKNSEDRVDDNVAQSSVASSSYSSVIYHDPPKQRYLKNSQGDSIPSAESSANFRIYHPKMESYLNTMSPTLVENLMKQEPQTFDLAKAAASAELQNTNTYQNQQQRLQLQHQLQQQQQKEQQLQQQQHQQYNNHNYNQKEEQKTEETVTKYLYPPKKYKSVEPGSQTIFNVGYSIGFGGSSQTNEKPQPSRLNSAFIGNEEVVTGKPKQPFRIRVEGKNSYWKQLSPGVEMSQNVNTNGPSSNYNLDTIISSTPRNNINNIQLTEVQTEGRSTFDHNHALTNSNPFDISNAVEPFITTQPVALPLTFPIPLQDTILLPQPPVAPPPSPQNLQTYVNEVRVAHPQNDFENQKKPKALDAKATGSGSFQTVHTTILPQDNFYANSFYNPQPDNLVLPNMQQVFITVGKDNQMIPAYLIPVTALNQYPTPPSSFFQQQTYLPSSTKSNAGNYPEQTVAATSSTISTEQQIESKPFKPSPPLNEPQIQSYHSSRPNDIIFKSVQNHIPKNLIHLRPPISIPEKQLQQTPITPSGASYQYYEQDNRPKFKTVLIRPVQLPLASRPSRDLASEQSMLNAILSQELFRKNSPPTRVPLLPQIPQTIYGMRNY